MRILSFLCLLLSNVYGAQKTQDVEILTTQAQSASAACAESEENRVNFLEILPEELTLYILGMLPSSDLNNFHVVCKKARKVTTDRTLPFSTINYDFYRGSKDYRKQFPPERVSRILVHSLPLSVSKLRNIKSIFPFCKILSLHFPNFINNQNILEMFDSLEEAKCLPLVSSVDLSGNTHLNIKTLHALKKFIGPMKKLRFSNSNFLDHELAPFFQEAYALEKLCLFGFGLIDGTQLFPTLREHSPHLKYLNLRHSKRLDRKAIEAFSITSLKALLIPAGSEHADVPGGHLFATEPAKNFLERCPNLQHLGLDYLNVDGFDVLGPHYQNFKQTIFDILAQASSLRSLSLNLKWYSTDNYADLLNEVSNLYPGLKFSLDLNDFEKFYMASS